MNEHNRPQPAIIDLSHEKAVDVLMEMKRKTDHSTSDCQVVLGDHPVYGAIYIIIPPSGNSRLLPLAIQHLEA